VRPPQKKNLECGRISLLLPVGTENRSYATVATVVFRQRQQPIVIRAPAAPSLHAAPQQLNDPHQSR